MTSGKTMLWMPALALSVCVVLGGEGPPPPGSFRPGTQAGAADFPKPYSPPCMERENVFEFTEKPKVKGVGSDKYEITFAVKGNCDVTVGIVDEKGVVARHLASGILGSNAPLPFQKNSLKQTLCWNGKDDLGEYVKEPEKWRVRVSLGLKPEFDKRLGGTSPYSLPGQPFGLAADPTGVYVFTAGAGPRLYVRKFDHDAKYVESLVPPPSRHPEGKLQGLSYVEYEKGKKALHAHRLYNTLGGWGNMFLTLNRGYGQIVGVQPLVIGDKLYYANSGGEGPSLLHYIFTDGATDMTGVRGIALQPPNKPWYLSVKYPHLFPHLAASPDGRWLYYTSASKGFWILGTSEAVWRKDLRAPDKFVEPLVGIPGEPGSDNAHLSLPSGIACDAAGRIYVADQQNNRIQIFTGDGRYLATLPVDRPRAVAVHPQTGALYVLHSATVQGRSVNRFSKFVSFDKPEPVAFLPIAATFLSVDSWISPPRIWLAGTAENTMAAASVLETRDGDSENTSLADGGDTVRVVEDQGNSLKEIFNFGELAKTQDGSAGVLAWGGDCRGRKVFCDPVREQVVVGRGCKFIGDNVVFDLKTGRALHSIRLSDVGLEMDDLAFDKKGYLHVHFDPGFYIPGVGRLDPGQATARKRFGKGEKDGGLPIVQFKEVPYDYGVEAQKERREEKWLGILPVKDQKGAKYFQDGIGVNMCGDVAEQANIYYAPKMDDLAEENLLGPKPPGQQRNRGLGSGGASYAQLLKDVEEKAKIGEETYFLPREPGLPASGATIWVFEATGKLLQQKSAVIMPRHIEGVHIDEDRNLYFVNNSPRFVGGKRFLNTQVGQYGEPDYKVGDLNFLQSGVLVKCGPNGAKIRMTSSPTPLDVRPERTPDVFPDGDGEFNPAWIEGAEWIYAGASPVVTHAEVCSCFKQNFHLDWFKRSYVPESYRHSIGILDTNGNLIMHLGRFGNLDDAARMSKGGEIIVTFNRFISGTDNYLVYEDYGERIVVLKLNYHAEESVGIAPSNAE